MNQIIRTNGHETIILFFLIGGGIQQREWQESLWGGIHFKYWCLGPDWQVEIQKKISTHDTVFTIQICTCSSQFINKL